MDAPRTDRRTVSVQANCRHDQICALVVRSRGVPWRGHVGESWREIFTDPQDGRLDGSRWLLEHRGVLPVPIVITEPAVGYGGGVALAYFHRAPGERAAEGQPRTIPPSVSAAVVAGTENGTRLGALGHLGIWREDTIRYTGGIAAISINLTFYGGEEFPRLDEGIEYNLDGWGTLQQLIWRWGESDFWIGLQGLYFDASAGLEETSAPAIFDRLNGDVTNASLGVVVSYDARDNILTPSRGLQSEWYVRQHWGEFNGDVDYIQVDGKNRWYFQPGKPWVIGWRLDASFTSGDVPFYARPSINQRGIAYGRYQGDAMVATEVETRYDIDGRWFGVAFAGVGRAADEFDELDATDSRWAGGVGFRYLISRVLGIQMGLDVARGPEEWAFYLQAGSGWGL